MTTWTNIPPRFRHKLNGAARATKPPQKTDAQRELDKAKREEHENALETMLIAAEIPFDKQVKMLERFELGYVWDFAIRGLMFQGRPTHCLAVEVNGGIWQKGGHNTGAGLLRDYEKVNHLLAYRGIPTLSVAPEHIADGRAVGWITSVYLRAVNQ